MHMDRSHKKLSSIDMAHEQFVYYFTMAFMCDASCASVDLSKLIHLVQC